MSVFTKTNFKYKTATGSIYIHGDCFQIENLKDNCIDLIATDPPYLISKKSGFHSGGAWNDSNDSRKRKTPPKMDFGEWDKEDLDLERLLKEFYRILKPGGTLLIFYDIFKMQELKEIADECKFKQPRLCVWQKTNPVPVNSKLNYLSNAREYFMTFVKKSKPTFNSEYDNGFYQFPICGGKERTEHTTQKPLSLITELIEKHSNVNDLVLDCFSGSNTTGEACLATDRRYIGIERDENYYNIGIERIWELI